MNAPVLIIIVIVFLAMLAMLGILKTRGLPGKELQFPWRVQLAISTGMTVTPVAAWKKFSLSPVILPALVFLQWKPLLRRRNLASPKAKIVRYGFVGLTVLMVAGMMLFWMVGR